MRDGKSIRACFLKLFFLYIFPLLVLVAGFVAVFVVVVVVVVVFGYVVRIAESLINKT